MMDLSSIIVLLFLVFTFNTDSISAQQPSTIDLIAMLDTINSTEQEPIRLRDELIRTHGPEAPEVRDQDIIVHRNHDINEIKVCDYLDQYGWPEGLGDRENRIICNVLQHSAPTVRVKYLPMMRGAVEADELEASLLARAEDRIATDRGELQIYGGQIKYYPESKSFDVWPIIDPINVDKRRAALGLPPMKEMLASRRTPLDWNVGDQVKRTTAFLNKKKE